MVQFGAVGIVLLVVAVALWGLHGATRRQARVLVLLACVLAAVLSASMFKYTVDDTYISLRYARNWARGYGPVFNPNTSQPVEGYTNFLWVAIEALFFTLGVGPEVAVTSAKVLGVLACLASIPILYLLGRTTWQDREAAACGAIVWASLPYVWFWSAAGLETGVYLFLLIASVYMTICLASRGFWWSVGSGVCFALCAMTRPEGVLLAAVTWGTVAVVERGGMRRSIVRSILCFLIIYVPYFVWRYHFYGYLLPNSFYAKTAIGGEPLHWFLARKLFEHGRFMQYIAPLVVAVAYVSATQSLPNRAKTLISVGSMAFALALLPYRQWMPGYRYDLPAAPFVVVLAAPGLTILLSHLQRRWRVVAVAATVLYLTFPVYPLMLHRNHYDRLQAGHIALGKWLQQWAPDDASFAATDMGAIPYYSDLPRIIDILPEGLLNTHTAHHGFDAQRLVLSRPSFFALRHGPPRIVPDGEIPPPTGPTGEIWASQVFQNEYRYLFTVCAWPTYNTRVYVRADIRLSDEALAAGYEMAQQSIDANNVPLPTIR